MGVPGFQGHNRIQKGHNTGGHDEGDTGDTGEHLEGNLEGNLKGNLGQARAWFARVVSRKRKESTFSFQRIDSRVFDGRVLCYTTARQLCHESGATDKSALRFIIPYAREVLIQPNIVQVKVCPPGQQVHGLVPGDSSG